MNDLLGGGAGDDSEEEEKPKRPPPKANGKKAAPAKKAPAKKGRSRTDDDDFDDVATAPSADEGDEEAPKAKLKGKGKKPGPSDGDNEGIPKDTPPESFMEAFFAEVATIKENMEDIRRNLHSLQDANEESKTVSRANKMKEIRARMQDDMDAVGKKAHECKDRIERLDKQNVEYTATQSKTGFSQAQQRTREAISASLKKKLKDLMGDFQVLRTKFQEEYKEVVERRYFTVTGKKADEKTIEHMIETGESETIFQKAITDQGRGQVLDTVAEIQERHDAIRELEAKLLDLHQIFTDMAVLVEAQGEMLDNIETQVAKSLNFVQQGVVALTDAKKIQKNTRAWMCCGLVIMLFIAGIIVISVLQPWKSGSARRRRLLLAVGPGDGGAILVGAGPWQPGGGARRLMREAPWETFESWDA